MRGPRRRARVRARSATALREVYGIPLMRPHGHPIAELVLTVLSQSTNDRNRDVAYLRLRERLPTLGAGRATRRSREVEEAIRPGGISKVKSARIQAILRAIAADAARPRGTSCRSTGSPRARSQEARDYLVALPGVGRKTAACVLLFASACATSRSTRTSRASARASACCAPGAPFEELHDQMLALTPPGEELELHVNLLRHGRRTCHARRPRARECALRACARAGDVRPAGASAARQHREGDHRVVQRGGGDHERVEDLVVAEHPRRTGSAGRSRRRPRRRM